jgi:hypothetical protein
VSAGALGRDSTSATSRHRFGRTASASGDAGPSLRPTRRGLDPGAAWRDAVLVLAAVAVNLTVVLSLTHFPYQDVVNHLTRYVLIARTWFGEGTPGITVLPIPTPYAGLDWLGALLVQFVGPTATARVQAIAPQLVLPLGMYALLRATAPSQTGWTVVAPLFGFSWFYLEGFINYCVGLGLAMLWLGCWWPRRMRTGWRTPAIAVVGVVGLYLTHLSSVAIVLVVVWCDVALHLLQGWHARKLRAYLASPRVRLAILTTATFCVFLAWTTLADAREPSLTIASLPRPWIGKLRNLGSPFFAFSLEQAAIMAAGFVIAFAYRVGAVGSRWRDPFLLASGVFFCLYLVSPANWALDLRWLAPAYLLPICRPTPPQVPRPHRAALLGVLICAIVHASIVYTRARSIDRELAAFDIVIAWLPDGARILPLDPDGGRHGRIRPYYHFALWHTIRKHGRVPGLFSRNGERPGAATWPHYSHFRVEPLRYFPPYGWGARIFEPLDCAQIREQFDFLVQAGTDPRGEQLIRLCVTDIALQVGDITAYRTTPVAPREHQ